MKLFSIRNFIFFGFLTSLLIWNFACTPFNGEPTISYKDGNTLMPSISFRLKEPGNAWVEFWPYSKENGIRTSQSSFGTDHSVTIVNLKAESRYQFRMATLGKGSNDTLRSREFNFNTGAVPQTVFDIRKVLIDTTIFNGYILIRRFFRSGADALIDHAGNIVWYHLYDIPVRRPITYTKKGTFLSIYDSAVIKEIDIYGNELLKIDLENSRKSERFHHDVIYDSTDNILTLSVDTLPINVKVPGRKPIKPLLADGILRLDKTGVINWRWSLSNRLPPTVINRYSGNGVLGHANTLLIDKDGHYLVSFRDFSQIWKIDSSTGRVMWKLGKNGDFSLPENAIFLRQHSIAWTMDGDLIMYDNGESKVRPQSRILVLKLDQINRSATVVDLIELPLEYSSYRMSSVQKIDNEHFLVCVTRKNATLLVVNRKGEVKWKAITDHASYRAELLKNPFPF